VRILWVKGGKLLPADTGGRLRSYNLLRFLAQKHQVTLLSYYGGKRDVQYESEIREHLPGAITIYTAALDSTAFARTLDYLIRLPQSAPHAVSKFTHPKVARAVTELLDQGVFDASVSDFLSASLNFPQKLHTPTVLFQHNVESALWRRMADVEGNLVAKLAYKLESAKMMRYERAALRRFHRVIAVSNYDRELMLQMEPACRISVVGTGVDTSRFTVAPPSTTKPPRIVFTGSMDWEPNIDAMEYFCRQILPRIQREIPDTRLQIVGRNPHTKVQRLASSSVEVTGTVPSVERYLKEASVVIIPLRIGGGTRLKIFEAMAMGKALVSTSIGAEGLNLESGRDIIIADDPASFAEAVLLLLRNDNVRRNYEQAAAQVASRHDWSGIAAQFAGVLQQTIEEQANLHNSPAALVPDPS
jgi:glycosyltransferase involved in cell wall biosynthesis